MNEYVMYKGEEIMHIGTVDEIAKERGVQKDTIRFYMTPTYKRRIAKRKNPRNYIEVFELEDEDDE